MFGSLNPAQWARFTNAANAVIKTGQGTLTGLLCSESSSLIVNVRDGTTTAGKLIVGPLTLTAGNPYPIPAKFNVGCFIEIVSGTGDATVFYD